MRLEYILTASIAALGCGGAVRSPPPAAPQAAPAVDEEDEDDEEPRATCDLDSYVDDLERADTVWTEFWNRLCEDQGDGCEGFYVSDPGDLMELDFLADVHERLVWLAAIREACGIAEHGRAEMAALVRRIPDLIDPYLADDAEWTLNEETRRRLQREANEVFDATGDAIRDALSARDAVARAVPGASPCEQMTRVRELEWREQAQEAHERYEFEERNQMNQGTWDEAEMSALSRQELDLQEIANLVAESPTEAIARLRVTTWLRGATHFAEWERQLVELETLCRPAP